MKQCSNLTILPICCPGVYPDAGRGTFKFQSLIRTIYYFLKYFFINSANKACPKGLEM